MGKLYCDMTLLERLRVLGGPCRELHLDAASELQRLTAENERLLKLIDEAPHTRNCEWLVRDFSRPCDCWKSKVSTSNAAESTQLWSADPHEM